MALSINGTTGVSGVDGSASATALQGTDSNTGINFASDTVNINTGGTTRATIDNAGALDVPTNFPIKVNGSEKLRIDSSGNLGIAVTPSDLLHLKFGTNLHMRFNSGVDSLPTINAQQDAGAYNGLGIRADNLRFHTGTTPAERLRIDSSGNVGINQTNPVNKFQVTVNSFNFQVSNTNARMEKSFSGSSSIDDDAFWMIDNDSNTGTYIKFWNTTSGANVIGSITHGTSNTNYNTSSDYRLKENITSISDGITRLKTLKPSRFNFKADTDTIVDGFIAHEVTAVPEAITGTKDEVAEKDAPELGLKKGDPVYQGIDQSKLVPLLTAALQEAVAKIETLETKVAALEAG